MAVAGSPLKAIPANARRTRNVVQLGAKAAAMVSSAEAVSETIITGRRPNTSDNELATSIATARLCVVSDSERLASAGLT